MKKTLFPFDFVGSFQRLFGKKTLAPVAQPVVVPAPKAVVSDVVETGYQPAKLMNIQVTQDTDPKNGRSPILFVGKNIQTIGGKNQPKQTKEYDSYWACLPTGKYELALLGDEETNGFDPLAGTGVLHGRHWYAVSGKDGKVIAYLDDLWLTTNMVAPQGREALVKIVK